MMVTFISQCQKSAIKRTRSILDAFSIRIGDKTWQTRITQEGLIAVKKQLSKTATKNTSVACHVVRSRSRAELLWIVGTKEGFSATGEVAVNYTSKKILKDHEGCRYTPLIKALSALSALFHDWGKATTLFQNKLKTQSHQPDPLRHEWVSVLLFRALFDSLSITQPERHWLQVIMSDGVNEKAINTGSLKNIHRPFKVLPSCASVVCWLILTHHRLPICYDKEGGDSYENYRDEPCHSMDILMNCINEYWGYRSDASQDRQKLCFEFHDGLLGNSSRWQTMIKKWSSRLYECLDILHEAIENGAIRYVLNQARLSLMLGDYYYSSLPQDVKWKGINQIYANTDRKSKELKQYLDEHLCGVASSALNISHHLSGFIEKAPRTLSLKKIKKSSDGRFVWQDRAVDAILAFKKQLGKEQGAMFMINMASTGCGKTLANAKIMQATSDDGVGIRYTLALGLRTLTLQTGDEYRERIGLDDSELAVLIGSRAIQTLHEQGKSISPSNEEEGFEAIGSESLESLMDESIDYDGPHDLEALNVIIENVKDRQFLYSPVLVCTIDHVMASVNTIKGGKYILPTLRLLTSDLVIDEIDDFVDSDIIAVGRLIHLAGMLGRKVMISSATIPPSLAQGLYHAYIKGWNIYKKSFSVNNIPSVCWVDEFRTNIMTIESIDAFKTQHDKFVNKRINLLTKQPVKRKGMIIDCPLINLASEEKETKKKRYYEKMMDAVFEKHTNHATTDPFSNKKISFGVVRISNIQPCVGFAKHAMSCVLRSGYEIFVMSYHSNQALLMRHEQEMYLDSVLKRKGEAPFEQVFKDQVVRAKIDQSDAENVIFLVVCTPVEEVGRDHDFDWAIIEPSSYRSIIQMAGRVRRHREGAVTHPNIGIMQYNIKAFVHGDKPGEKYFLKPGYETSGRLITHDIRKLVDEKNIRENLTAGNRILSNEKMPYNKSLSEFEHKMIAEQLTDYTALGPETLEGYMEQYWYLSGLPIAFHAFRKSTPEIKIFLHLENENIVFSQKNDEGEMIDRGNILGIIYETNSNKRSWLDRSYNQIVLKYASMMDVHPHVISSMYGELSFNWQAGKQYLYSDLYGLVKCD